MNISEIRQLSLKKLYVALKEARMNYRRESIHLKTGHSVATHKLGFFRKQIARIKTVLTEKVK